MKNASQLLQEMNERLQAKGSLEYYDEQHIREYIDTVAKAIAELKGYILSSPFSNDQEEMHFFRKIKPEFDGRMIFYLMLLKLNQCGPTLTPEDKRNHYQRELQRLQAFYDQYHTFWLYCQMEYTHMDNHYFLRPNQDDIQFLEEESMYYDHLTNAPMSALIAKFQAYELFREHITNQLIRVEHGKEDAKNKKQFSLTWTTHKNSLIELIYAFHEYGVFSKTVDIKKIADYFSMVFNVKFGNIYKSYEDIRLRKKNRTAFLDSLRAALERRIDRDDEHAM